MEYDANPMSKAHAAPRCTAVSKRTGERCKAPARKGWKVCRMHGAGGGAPIGPTNGAWVHGDRSQAAQKDKETIATLVKTAQTFVIMATDQTDGVQS